MKSWDTFFEGPHTFDPEQSFYTNDRRLERNQYGMDTTIPPASIRFNVEENIRGEMQARILYYVYQEQVGDYTHSVPYPATWWDHTKQDLLPLLGKVGNWLLKRYPIKYTTKTVYLNVQTMYPEFRPLDGYGKTFYIVKEMGREWSASGTKVERSESRAKRK